MNNRPFEKLSLSIEDQLKLLLARGLTISDQQIAKHYLKFISYYHFCGYAIEFENSTINDEKRYREGTTFEQVLDCYIFDRKLRLLVIDAIERIENELSFEYGAHWYLNKSLFLDKFKHEELLETIKKETLCKAKDGTIQH